MTHVQIFKDPETNKPLWAVIHGAPEGMEQDKMEERVAIVDGVSTILSRVTGSEAAVLLASGAVTVEVI